MDINDLKRTPEHMAAINDGEWVSDIPGMGSVRMRVRGLSSPKVAAARSRLERAVPRKERDRDGGLTHEKSMAISAEILHRVVLIDWDGISAGGEIVNYSAEQAKEWCTNPAYREFADAVAWAAMTVDRGAADEAEDIEGN